MAITETATAAVDFIPNVIAWIRENVLFRIIDLLNLPEQSSFTFIVAGIALFGAYLWIKQWVTTSLFLKLSTFLNYILLALLIYVVLVYV